MQNAGYLSAMHLGKSARRLGAFCCVLLSMFFFLPLCAAASPESRRYEAEEAVLLGSNEILSDGDASGGRAAGRFSRKDDALVFQITVPSDGFYDLAFTGKGIGNEKYNLVFADGVQLGEVRSPADVYGTDVLQKTALTKGAHEIRIQESWGWIYLDCLTVTRADPISDCVYEVTQELSNPNATEEAIALYRFLRDSYGRYTLSGQYAPDGIDSAEITAIHDLTGKYPALLGLDMANYTPSRLAFADIVGQTVERAIEYHERGGIVSFSWHWSAPYNTVLPPGRGVSATPWWHGYLTENCSFRPGRVMRGEDPEGELALLQDIQAIAVQLKRLEEAGVPVLWRPLHEASGGWFWWGADGPEVYKQLWVFLYKTLTEVYGCNNLIWVCNCQNPAWYPGDDYVDIVGQDIYPLPRQYGPWTDKFAELTEYPGKEKIAALTEDGVVPDIDRCLLSNVRWAWFCTWNEEYVVRDGAYSSEYTEAEMLRRVYDSDFVLTLEELPQWMPEAAHTQESIKE